MSVLNLMAKGNLMIISKDIMYDFGIEAAVFISELAEQYEAAHWQNKVKDGWFCSPVEDVAEDTTLEASQQNKILKELQHEEILEVKMVGKPAERYIKFDERRLSCALGTYERRFDEDLKGVNNE